jgi:hypothetical protein
MVSTAGHYVPISFTLLPPITPLTTPSSTISSILFSHLSDIISEHPSSSSISSSPRDPLDPQSPIPPKSSSSYQSPTATPGRAQITTIEHNASLSRDGVEYHMLLTAYIEGDVAGGVDSVILRLLNTATEALLLDTRDAGFGAVKEWGVLQLDGLEELAFGGLWTWFGVKTRWG